MKLAPFQGLVSAMDSILAVQLVTREVVIQSGLYVGELSDVNNAIGINFSVIVIRPLTPVNTYTNLQKTRKRFLEKKLPSSRGKESTRPRRTTLPKCLIASLEG